MTSPGRTERRDADLFVIGGGIVGLSVARAWLRRSSTSRVLVLDEEARAATHQSGRNSGASSG